MRVADRLSDTDEAALRTAIGRVYYAVFCKNRETLSSAGLINTRGDDSDHRLVWEALKKSKREGAANSLRNLRVYRNRADYDLTAPVTRRDWVVARDLAQEIIRLCSPDWDKPAELTP